MIKFKKSTALLVCAITLGGPLAASADEYDQKIAEQDQKIADLTGQQGAVQTQQSTLQQEITDLETQVNDVLKQKTTEEKKLSELTSKIQVLQEKIEKREARLKEQARNVQTDQGSMNLVSAVIDAESFGEFVEKTVAVTKMVSTSNETMTQQKADKDALKKLETEAKTKLETINTKTNELKAQQDKLVEAKLSQDVKANQLQASLATEVSQKEQYQAQQAEAERKREEALKVLEEQRKAEETARQQAQKEAQAAAAKAAEEAEKQAAEAETAAQAAAAQVAAATAQEQAQAAQTATDATANNTVVSTPTPSTSAPASNASGFASPLGISLVVTSPFGTRVDPTGASGTQHDGIDFAGATGTSIFASKAGTVVESGFHWSAGNHVVIQHPDGYYTYYMHMVSSPSVSVGQSVSAGQVLGGMGTTGNSTGVHLHFGVSTALWSGFLNPAPLLGI